MVEEPRPGATGIRARRRRAKRGRVTKTDYIPELSEVRMVRRAPEAPLTGVSAEDAQYLFARIGAVNAAFGLDAFAGLTFAQIPARALIHQFIEWWRTLEPETDAQREAHGQLPGAIRLIDTVSTWLEEQAGRRR